MARSLNRAQLIGNLTRDPELRYTPNGTAVCSFGLATNRSWKTDTGEKREEAEFHRIVAWNKLAELCSQFLVKGRKVYVEGRIATRNWTGQDGAARTTTEIIISDMILLDSKRAESEGELQEAAEVVPPAQKQGVASANLQSDDKKQKKEKKDVATQDKDSQETKKEEVEPSDIPF